MICNRTEALDALRDVGRVKAGNYPAYVAIVCMIVYFATKDESSVYSLLGPVTNGDFKKAIKFIRSIQDDVLDRETSEELIAFIRDKLLHKMGECK